MKELLLPMLTNLVTYDIFLPLDNIGYLGYADTYLNELYERILFVLQITPDNKEFVNYKKVLEKLKN